VTVRETVEVTLAWIVLAFVLAFFVAALVRA
jgi:hypothetical protein